MREATKETINLISRHITPIFQVMLTRYHLILRIRPIDGESKILKKAIHIREIGMAETLIMFPEEMKFLGLQEEIKLKAKRRKFIMMTLNIRRSQEGL